MLRSMAADDPAAFLRSMLAEWEKMANSVGGAMLRSDEWSRGMNSASGATMNAQAASKDMMERALAAAQLPSRAEFEDLSARLARIEAALERIELRIAGGTPVTATKPKPSRSRKPPEAKG
jgi:hypothetical protein